jgi:hypothetical protein
MVETMWQRVPSFAERVSDDRLVFDATPGSRLMTPALEQLARRFRPAAWLFYVRHRMEQQRVVLFFERLCR